MREEKQRSFLSRYTLQMIVLIILALVVTYAFETGFTYRIIYRNMITFGRNMLDANTGVIDDYFAGVDEVAAALIYNGAVNDELKAYHDSNEGLKTLKSMEQLVYHARPDLHLTLYKENAPRKAYSIYSSADYATIQNFRTTEWYQKLRTSPEGRLLLTNIHPADENTQDSYVHSMIYRIDDLYSDAVIGYLRIDLDLAYLQEKLLLDFSTTEGVSIMTPEGETLFSTGDDLSTEDTPAADSWEEDGLRIRNLPRELILSEKSEETGWIVSLSLSKQDLFRQQAEVGLVYYLVTLFAIIVCLIVVSKIMGALSGKMERLSFGLREVQKGNLNVTVDPQENDEIEQVISQFNVMVSQINRLMGEIEAKQKLLSDAQLKALQQQINPHFIYNSLETVMGMASVGMNDEVIEISRAISAMLRYNTKMDAVTTVREEIDQVRSYMKVMLLRMQGRLTAECIVDPDCENSSLVKFSLQPLVENAIEHGVSGMARDGRIEVRASREDDETVIRVVDNGRGMTEETLAGLRRQLEAEDTDYLRRMEEQSVGTGLLNVHMRLKLHYKEKYHIRIASELGKGTEIELRLPFDASELQIISGTGMGRCTELS